MEIKLNAGDSIAIPQGLKAEIKEGVVVFSEVKPKFETFGDLKKYFPNFYDKITFSWEIELYCFINEFYDFFDKTLYEICIFRTIDFDTFECKIYENDVDIKKFHANTRKEAFLDGLFYLCGIYEKTL